MSAEPADPGGDLPHMLQRHVGVLVMRTAHIVKGRIEAGMEPGGLRVRHYAVLQILRTEGAVSQQAVGARLDVDAGTVVDLIDTLEERGLVERRRNPRDRRVYRLHLTAAGGRAIEELEPVLTRLEEDALAPLTPTELDTLKALLTRVVAHAR